MSKLRPWGPQATESFLICPTEPQEIMNNIESDTKLLHFMISESLHYEAVYCDASKTRYVVTSSIHF